MELRVLEYFLAVAREESISKAAEFLHLTQPTLSRQLKDLEEELGKQLFLRGSRKVTLTEDGMYLRNRAEEILELVHRTQHDLMQSEEIITGEVAIGCGETDAIRHVVQAILRLQEQYPQIHYSFVSGDSANVLYALDKGLVDFGVVLGQLNLSKYEALPFPTVDTWGILMRKDAPLAQKGYVEAEDLWELPLLLSRQVPQHSRITDWLKRPLDSLHIAAYYNLIYNASIMVEEGLGYALTLDKLINTSGHSSLAFLPLRPALDNELHLIWKRYQVFSRAAEKFLEAVKSVF
ncbi:MAG: LysR family transcriptional regulator [Lachnospiraceae bacterium]|nr:LysR family transcriptional regulator [Lachnospiraceae bacterium]MCI9149799.1 LysR family transcriptional regulator [Lachnospiraceae bacterium]